MTGIVRALADPLVIATALLAAAAAAGASYAFLPALRGKPGQFAVLGVIIALSVLVAQLPAPAQSPRAMHGLAIVLATVMLWATQALPAWVSGLAFFAVALPSLIAPPLPLLSGFWSNAAALVFGGLLLGTAAERSGLGRFVARGLVERFVTSYPMFLLGILIGAGALSFLVPATMGRLALTIPIVAATAKAAGYEPGSNGYLGAMATTVAGNFLTAFAILPANLTNVIAIGAMEGLHGPIVRYGEFLLYGMPVLGLAKGVLFWAMVIVLCPAPAPKRQGPGDVAGLAPAGRRLALILAITVLGWATDFVHGVQPGWIALAAGLACILPGIGLVEPREAFDLNKANAILSLAAVLGLATVLTRSGASDLIGPELARLAAVEGRSAVYGFIAIAVMASLTAAVATSVGAIATITPVIGPIAAATGLSLPMGLMAELTGLQCVYFPFEAVPLMVGFAMAKVATGAAIRVLAPIGLVSLVTIVPLNAFWLWSIGAIR